MDAEMEKFVYEELANAVVAQAVKDYHDYKEKLKTAKNPRQRYEYLKQFNDADMFLHSKNLSLFTSLPVTVLLGQPNRKE